MKNKAKDGGDLVWLYYVRHKNIDGNVLSVTVAENDEELRRRYDDGDIEYPIEELYFQQISVRRFSRNLASRKVEKTLKKIFDNYCIDRPIYSI